MSKLILVSGVNGGGKTTLCEYLRDNYGYEICTYNDYRFKFAEQVKKSFSLTYWSKEDIAYLLDNTCFCEIMDNNIWFEVLLHVVEKKLKDGKRVVIDGVGQGNYQRAFLVNFERLYGVTTIKVDTRNKIDAISMINPIIITNDFSYKFTEDIDKVIRSIDPDIKNCNFYLGLSCPLKLTQAEYEIWLRQPKLVVVERLEKNAITVVYISGKDPARREKLIKYYLRFALEYNEVYDVTFDHTTETWHNVGKGYGTAIFRDFDPETMTIGEFKYFISNEITELKLSSTTSTLNNFSFIIITSEVPIMKTYGKYSRQLIRYITVNHDLEDSSNTYTSPTYRPYKLFNEQYEESNSIKQIKSLPHLNTIDRKH